ncbi:hypothetical protein THIOKS12870001 [Thiocapsa sp. KS1]|nr:hypothetical protein THIOKS12870001 [Thiocapsa sp. KS1]
MIGPDRARHEAIQPERRRIKHPVLHGSDLAPDVLQPTSEARFGTGNNSGNPVTEKKKAEQDRRARPAHIKKAMPDNA